MDEVATETSQCHGHLLPRTDMAMHRIAVRRQSLGAPRDVVDGIHGEPWSQPILDAQRHGLISSSLQTCLLRGSRGTKDAANEVVVDEGCRRRLRPRVWQRSD